MKEESKGMMESISRRRGRVGGREGGRWGKI